MQSGLNKKDLNPWGEDSQYLIEMMDVDPDDRFTEQEVKKRRQEEGLNRLRTRGEKNTWSILFEKFQNIIVLNTMIGFFIYFGRCV